MKKFIKILIIVTLIFLNSSYLSLAQTDGINVNLNIGGSCNNNGICEPSAGEDMYSCPADCVVDTGGGGGGGETSSAFFENLTVETSYNSAIIRWTSNVPIKFNFKWGRNINYSDGVLQNINFNTKHEVSLSNLLDGTYYFFSIEGESALGDKATLDNQKFMTLVKPDTTPPANPTNLNATSDVNGITISWHNPTDADFDYIRVMRNTNSFPTDYLSGYIVYEGGGQYFTDSNVVLNQKYYYSLFARDNTGNYSSGAFISIVYTVPTTETKKNDGTGGNGEGGGGGTTTTDNGSGNKNSTTGGKITETPIINIITKEDKLPAPVRNTTKKVREIILTPVGDTTSKVITTGGVAIATFAGFASLFTNIFSFGDLILVFLRLWSFILILFGLRKKSRPWGTVYDSITKQPLDPAYVVLQDLEGNEIATSITDLDGRYGFLVPPGKYRIVVNKTNYSFPSIKLKDKTSDELYVDLYLGGEIEIKEGEVIAKNIPMDPIKFDWNEFAKNDHKLMKFFSRRDLFIYRMSNIIFILGFIVTILEIFIVPSLYSYIIFGLYIFLFILKNTVLKRNNSFGLIKYKINDNPLSFAIMRVFHLNSDVEVIHKVADKTGKYYCLLPTGKYYAKIENKNIDESYTLVYTSTPIDVKRGYLSKIFEI